jgi:hypothetical protein
MTRRHIVDVDVLLCDHAQVSGEKLFIAGANIDRVGFPAGSPAPYVINLAVAGVVHVPWTQTNAEHALVILLVTEDGHTPSLPEGIPVGPQGVGGEIRFNVGRPPQLTGGEEQIVPFAFNFQGLPLMQGGRYNVSVSIDGTEMRRVPFTLFIEPQRNFGPASIPGM